MRARCIWTFLLLVALASPALAQGRRGGLDRVLPQVSRSVPGTFYDAEGPFMTADGRSTYRIKWGLPDGRVVWLTVDAGNGQVIGGVPRSAPSYRDNDRDDRRDRYERRRDDRRDWNDGDRRGNSGDSERQNWRSNGRDWNRGGSDRGGYNRGGYNRGGNDRGGNDRGGNDRGSRDRRHGG